MKNTLQRRSFWNNKTILITGGNGFVGTKVVENLVKKRKVRRDSMRIPQIEKDDLRIFENVRRMTQGVDVVLHLAADVGGVGYSNAHPATQFRNCMLIDLNVFEAAARERVKKLVVISSAVGYSPRARSPLKEEDFFLDVPAATGYGYGFAKRMAVVAARAYRQEKGLNAVVVVPTNAYGPGQDINLETGHVIPSLIVKCLTQKSLVVWGDGTPRRDFLYVDDLAEAVIRAAELLEGSEPVNVGTGGEVTIKQLVSIIIRLTGFHGRVTFDTSRPKGQPRRSLDISRAKKLLGFTPRWSLEDGLRQTIAWIQRELKRQ